MNDFEFDYKSEIDAENLSMIFEQESRRYNRQLDEEAEARLR
jgi:hypothetical protein